MTTTTAVWNVNERATEKAKTKAMQVTPKEWAVENLEFRFKRTGLPHVWSINRPPRAGTTHTYICISRNEAKLLAVADKRVQCSGALEVCALKKGKRAEETTGE